MEKNEDVRIGLVLGAGGVRGLAHLGVLEVLESAEIPVCCIAGSSAGALVGALYADGHSPREIFALYRRTDVKQFLDFRPSRYGLLRGTKILKALTEVFGDRDLADFPLPVFIAATDLKSGELVVFREGPAPLLLRASIALPGLLEPVFYGRYVLVDGGVVARLPAEALREESVDLVIGVDVSPAPPVRNIRHVYDVLVRTMEISGHHLIRCKNRDVDVLIQPNLNGVRSTLFVEDPERLLEGGREAALRALPVIRKKIKKIKALRR
ncbi:MAG: patatin-like phospholipase family protein [Brockia lithotrophica]|nr:patatin-like phospholipase family protein [Brockia lithotrophica]